MTRHSIESSSLKENKDHEDMQSIDRSDVEDRLPSSSSDIESTRPTTSQKSAPPFSAGTVSTSQPPPPPPPPNGGIYAWTCTACCFLINAHTWGLNSSYGVFLASYLANNTFGRNVSSLEYAFVGGLSISCAMLVAPLATLSTRYFGTRVTLLTGVFFETLSLIAASFASQIWHLFLSQGVCFGVGMGFLFVGSVSIVPQYFTTKRSMANGIAAAGSGIGGLTYSLAAGAMIRSIGLAWTFRVLAIIAFTVNTTCALIIRDRNKIIGSSQSAFAAELFKRVEFLLLCAYAWFSMLAYVVLIFSLPNYANAIGLSASQASVIGALLNLGQAIGRPPIGYFSDSLGRINMAALTTFLAGFFCFVIWIPANGYGVLIAYVLIGGTVAGTFWTTIAPVMAETVGLKHVPSALNLLWLVIVLPVTFSEAIALEIVDGTGGYLGTQLWAGFMFVAAALCLVALRGWKIGELEEIAKLEGLKGEKLDPVVAEAEAGEEVAHRARIAGRRSILANFWRWRKV